MYFDRVQLAEKKEKEAIRKANMLEETVRFNNQKFLKVKGLLQEVEVARQRDVDRAEKQAEDAIALYLRLLERGNGGE
jgi:hypothetical protein